MPVGSSGWRRPSHPDGPRLVDPRRAPASSGATAGAPRRSWDRFFPVWYRSIRLVEPLLRRWLRRRRIGDTVELVVVGRRTGLPRSVLVGLLELHGRLYVGHPTATSAWTSNLDAAGTCTVIRPGGDPVRFAAVPLAAGPERDAVIRATFRQHPFPGDVLYWLARGHVREAGRFYRLEPLE